GSAPRFGSGPVLGSSTPLGGVQQPLGSVAPFGEGSRAAPGETPATRPGHPVDRRAQGLSRRTRQGAGVVFSGLVLGALAFINLPGEQSTSTSTWRPGEHPENAVQPASAQHRPAPASTTAVGEVRE